MKERVSILSMKLCRISSSVLPLGVAFAIHHDIHKESICMPAITTNLMDDEERNNQSTNSNKNKKRHKVSYYSHSANDPCEDRAVYFENSDSNARICGVFDGHGGWNVSHYLQNNFVPTYNKKYLHHSSNHRPNDENKLVACIQQSLMESFDELENSFIKKVSPAFELGFGEVARVGSCALVSVIDEDNLIVANAGDCLAVLGREDKEEGVIAHQINREHNARSQLERFLLTVDHPDEDDIVVCKSPHACYVKGRLQLTRAFGDLYLKKEEFNAPPGEHRSRGRHISSPYTPPYVNHTPDIYSFKINKNQDQFVIMATDGLWDFIEPQEAVDIVSRIWKKSPELAAKALVEEALHRAAERANLTVQDLKNLPLGRQRRRLYDDTTVVVLYL